MPLPSATGDKDPQESARAQAEAGRLGALLRAREEELAETRARAEAEQAALQGLLAQREEAIRLLQGSTEGGGDLAQLAQEKAALAQRVDQLQGLLGEAGRGSEELKAAGERLSAERDQAVKQRDEYQQQVHALNDRCASLMTQFESLRQTCQNLSLEAQQKTGLEGQMAELMRMNAQWQQVHQSVNEEAETLRKRSAAHEQLQQEVEQLREVQEVCRLMDLRLREAETQAEELRAGHDRHQAERADDRDTIRRLQTTIECIQENTDSEAGRLEAELLERTRECGTYRRDVEELRRRVEELVKEQLSWREDAGASRQLREEIVQLKADLEKAEEEKVALNGVVERCLEKLHREGQERPHLVDKRMVTQMLAAYLEQRDNQKRRDEVMAKMADLLGFTAGEREQVGLLQKRKSLSLEPEPLSFEELTNQFVDFLHEEVET